MDELTGVNQLDQPTKWVQKVTQKKIDWDTPLNIIESNQNVQIQTTRANVA